MITWRLIIASLVALLGSAGTNGFISVALNMISPEVRNWMNTILADRYNQTFTQTKLNFIWSGLVVCDDIGIIIGSLIGGALSNAIGRKAALTLSSLPSILGCIMQLSCRYVKLIEFLFIGRFSAGIGIGTGTVAASLLMNEISPISYRGRLGFAYCLIGNAGKAISFFITIPAVFGADKLWHYCFVIGCAFPLLLLVFMPCFPESSRHLFLKKGDKSKAAMSIQYYQHENQEYIDGILDVTLAMVINKSVSGYIIFMTYSTEVLLNLGTTPYFAKYLSTCIGVISVIGTAISMFLVDSNGRRPLLLISIWGVFASLNIFFIAGNFMVSGSFLQLVSFSLAICLWSALYGLGMGPLTYSFIPELWDQRYRASVQGLSVATSSTLSLLMVFLVPYLMSFLKGYIFLVFIIPFSVLSIYLSFQCPETKNRTITQIVLEMNSKSLKRRDDLRLSERVTRTASLRSKKSASLHSDVIEAPCAATNTSPL